MLSFALRRILAALPILLGVATLVFLIMSLAPGDPALIYLHPGIPAETLEAIRRNMGLDDPLPVRYVRWLFAFVRGDFGYSYFYQMPVRARILAVLPNTLILGSVALLLAFLVGITVGIVQAVKQNSILDSALSGITLFFYSMPSFWLGLMLILIFALGAKNFWDWPFSFPVSGIRSPGADLLGPWDQLKDRVHHL